MKIGSTNEDYQNKLLKKFREEADFINKFYGLGDKDHFTAIELGHIYELMKEYKKSSSENDNKALRKHNVSCSVPSDVLNLLKTITGSDDRMYREKARELIIKYCN